MIKARLLQPPPLKVLSSKLMTFVQIYEDTPNGCEYLALILSLVSPSGFYRTMICPDTWLRLTTYCIGTKSWGLYTPHPQWL